MHRVHQWMILVTVALLLYAGLSSAYAPGDFVHFSRRGQYHVMRTPWHDQLGRHCPRFGINSEVVLPLPKPLGYTGSDPYKISLQFGNEKYGTPWLFVIGRKGPDVPMIDINLKYSGADLLGVTAKIVPMPETCEILRSHLEDFCRKRILPSMRASKQTSGILINGQSMSLFVMFALNWLTDLYKTIEILPLMDPIRSMLLWEEKSELDVSGGLFVLFGSGFVLTVFLALHILQSSKEKLSRFLQETVVQGTVSGGEAKAD